ncbi:hypothetical protein AALP_AAs48659U000100, partial [Arabis alpina]
MPIGNNFSGNFSVAVALLFLVGLYICFSSSSISDPISDFLHLTTPPTLLPGNKLQAALEKAAAGNNKTVIIAMVNKAYVEEAEAGRTMLDLFLESFWEGEGTLPLM